MNQILDYSPNKNSGGNSSRSDKIVRIFALFLILFAICLLVLGGYGYFKKNAEKKQELANTPTKAKISIEQEDDEIKIMVEHDKVIKEIVYNWDTEKDRTVTGTGESTMELTIPAVAGKHSLNIKVTDIDNVETDFSEVISSSTGQDKIRPNIDIELVTVEEDGENVKKLKITAKDETAMDYVTYRWNNDEETKIDETSEDGKQIEFYVKVLKDTNNLFVVAYDKGGNEAHYNNDYTGVTKPSVNILVAPDKKSVDITCTHENGLKSIECTINDQLYNIEIEEGQKDATFNVPLEEGNNKITVKAKSVDQTETVAEDEILNEPQAEEPEQPEEPNNPVEDEIKIEIKKNEENEGLAYIEINTSGIIKDIRLNVNEADYAVNVPSGEYPGLNFDSPIEDGDNVISVTVITENGTEKTETQEIRR